MIVKFLAKIFGSANERKLKALKSIVDKINLLEKDLLELDNEQLAGKTNEFRERISKGESLDDVLPDAFAVVREASKRVLGERHFDVQLMAGIILHQGKISEMKTGEGKTLAATLPLYLNALGADGSHLVTVNDYLAKRDAEWMGKIYNSLGLSVGCLQNSTPDIERKKVYQSDILYATNNELGFDYLRDNMKVRLEDYVQKRLSYAIVDEVDSILIDEARTPLIISGASEKSSKLYTDTNNLVKSFKKDVDYEIDEKLKSVHLTESAVDKAEKAFNIKNLYALENLKILHHVNQAVKAHAIFKLDVEYVVRDKQVMIVDEFTGRMLQGRRYSDGLHQAIEAKEGVPIESESQTVASITLQNYFRLYDKLAGMTGTALTEAEEFWKIYKLDVVSVPTNKPLIREDKPDLIFLTKEAKYKAIAEDIKVRHKKGQPSLIGTVSIETSEYLSHILTSRGMPHDVLNAKQHGREAEIVLHAGEPGKVTIATNMAGRGTDIKLTEESRNAGGLYILGTERHESRRIDNQLRGRSGRQGDPGESRFYISLEDNLIRIFAGETLKKNMHRFGMKDDEVIESSFVSKRIESAQEKVEKQNFEYRKHILEYDDVLNQQRIVVYKYRRSALEGQEKVEAIIQDQISGLVMKAHARMGADFENISTSEKIEKMLENTSSIVGIPVEEIKDQKLNLSAFEKFKSDLIEFLLLKYSLISTAKEADEEDIRSKIFKEAQKWVVLEAIDRAWKQHMLNLDHLKEGIGLRGWGQKNPLIEYKREAFAMFEEMLNSIGTEIVSNIFRLRPELFDKVALEEKRKRELEQLSMNGGEGSGNQGATQRKVGEKIKRNSPCPCGSGKKYKNCCAN